MSILFANSIAKRAQIPTPPEREIYDEGAATLDAQARLAPQQAELINQYGSIFDASNISRLQDALYGNSYFDAARALASMPADQRAAIEAEAERTGYSPEEWFAGHVADQQGRGDAVAQDYAQDFGGREGGGLVDISRELNNEAVSQTNAANSAFRQAYFDDVSSLGGQARAQLEAINPGYYNSVSRLTDNAFNAAPSTPGVTSDGPAAAQARFNAAQAQEAGLTQARGSSLMPGLERDATRNLGRVSSLQNTLQGQAAEELALNGQLSAEAQRNVEQSVRSASEARGLTLGNSSIFQEAMGKESLTRQRQAEARSLALAVDQAGQGQITNNRNYAMGVSDRGNALSQFNAGAANDTSRFNAGLSTQVGLANAAGANDTSRFNAGQTNSVNQSNASRDLGAQQFNAQLAATQGQQNFQNQLAATQAERGAAYDPFAGIFGQQSSNQTTTGDIFNPAAATVSGGATEAASMFSPYGTYSSDLYNTNLNAVAGTNIANSNITAGVYGGAIAADANVAGNVASNF